MAQTDDTDDTHTLTIKVPNVALLDIHNTGASTAIIQSFTKPTEAGEALTAPTDDQTTWLNYSSVVNASQVRKVTVSASALIPGVTIKVTAATSTTGSGTLGTTNGQQTIVAAATGYQVLKDIGSSFTTDGASKGSKVTYSISSLAADTGSLVAADHTITMTYTLLDQ